MSKQMQGDSELDGLTLLMRRVSAYKAGIGSEAAIEQAICDWHKQETAKAVTTRLEKLLEQKPGLGTDIPLEGDELIEYTGYAKGVQDFASVIEAAIAELRGK